MIMIFPFHWNDLFQEEKAQVLNYVVQSTFVDARRLGFLKILQKKVYKHHIFIVCTFNVRTTYMTITYITLEGLLTYRPVSPLICSHTQYPQRTNPDGCLWHYITGKWLFIDATMVLCIVHVWFLFIRVNFHTYRPVI